MKIPQTFRTDTFLDIVKIIIIIIRQFYWISHNPIKSFLYHKKYLNFFLPYHKKAIMRRIFGFFSTLVRRWDCPWLMMEGDILHRWEILGVRIFYLSYSLHRNLHPNLLFSLTTSSQNLNELSNGPQVRSESIQSVDLHVRRLVVGTNTCQSAVSII